MIVFLSARIALLGLLLVGASLVNGKEALARCQIACDPNEYIFENSNRERLPEWMIQEFNSGSNEPGFRKLSLRLARNEIYARRGYIFRDQELQKYFDAKNWYRPVSRDVKLSPIEQYNVDLIKRYEDR
ncbi:hypothetical protein CCP2SC5_1090008 [Azospirillaceae bacterium]